MIKINVQIDNTVYPSKPTTKDAGDIKYRLLWDKDTYYPELPIDKAQEAHLANKTVVCGAVFVESQEEKAKVDAKRKEKGKKPAKGICEESFNPARGGANYFLFDCDNDIEKFKTKHPEAKKLPPLLTPTLVKQILDLHGLHSNTGYETSSSFKMTDQETGKEYPVRFRFGIALDSPIFSADEYKKLGEAVIALFPKGYIDSSTNHIDSLYYGTDKGEEAIIPELIDFENPNSLDTLWLLADSDTARLESKDKKTESEYRALFRAIEKNYREKGIKPVIKDGQRFNTMSSYAYDVLRFFDPEEVELAKHDFFLMASFCEGDFDADAQEIWANAVRDAPINIWNDPDRIPRVLMTGIFSKATSRFILYRPDSTTKTDAYNNPINQTPQDPETIAQAREKRLQELKAKTPYASKTVDAFKDEISDDNFYYVDTGFARLNDILGGGIYTGLHMVGAETGLGKTTLALQIADHISSMGHDVIFIEMEMTRSQLMARSISRLSYLFSWFDDSIAFEAQEILNPDAEIKQASNFTASFDTALEDYRNRVGKCLRFCCELGNTTTDDIRLLVEDHINGFTPEDGEPRKEHRPVLIVDYLQILNSMADLSMNDKQKIDLSINDLKLISNEFHIPILSISSLNRGAYGEPAGLSALKETGSIEYTADTVWIIQIDGADPKGNESKEKRSKRIFKLNETVNQLAEDGQPVWVEIKVLKNRFGKKGKVPLDYLARYNYFSAGDYSERAKIRAEADAKEASQKIKARDRALAQSALETDKKIEASKANLNEPFDFEIYKNS